MQNNTYEHKQAAHCESGVVSSLLTYHGLPMSEPMAFGLSSAITFAYIPIVKLNGLPLIAYRMPPRFILKGIQKLVGVKFSFKKFGNPSQGMAELDKKVTAGELVGMQGSVYWLPYFPEDMRFHFNGHNMLAFGKQGDDYLISDPIFEEAVTITPIDLQRSRFAKGALAAKGLMYTVQSVPQTVDYEKAIEKSIKKSTKIMLKTPVPVIGIKGIRFVAGKIRNLENTLKTKKKIRLWLGHMIRMQEEIGTGGAGFRFIYASFLQEASELINKPELAEASKLMTEAGDQWRKFALASAKACKGKESMNLDALAKELELCADLEKKAWERLEAIYK